MSFYAVACGRIPGIFMTWKECEKQVKGFSGARFKKFATEEQAHEFILNSSSASFQKSKNGKRRPRDNNSDSDEGSRKLLKCTSPNKLPSVLNPDPDCKRPQHYQIWTDGSCDLDESGGYGYVVTCEGKMVAEEFGSMLEPPFTAPHAEVLGVIHALTYMKNLFPDQKVPQEEKQGLPSFDLFSDSQFVIKTITLWGPKRSEKEWENKKHAHLFKEILSFVRKWNQRAVKPIVFQHVKAHAGNKYNEKADELAGKGNQQSRQLLGLLSSKAPSKKMEVHL